MKKLVAILFVIASFLCIPLTLGTNVIKTNAAPCESEYIITFDCNGGTYNGSATFTQVVQEGELVLEPDESLLKRNNATFMDWVTSSGKYWYFDKDVVETDFTLYAKWDWDNSQLVNIWGNGESCVRNYLSEKYYGSKDWEKVLSYSTSNVT